MLRRFLGVFSLLLASSAWATEGSAAAPEIVIASEVWAGHTNADGSGLGWDILRAVYEPVGVRLRIRNEPYTRSVGLVQRHEADAWMGAYRDEVAGAVYPRWHYDADQISALGKAGAPVPSLETLGHYRLVWIRGYDYQQYLPNLKHFEEIQRSSGILSMLDLGHVDYYIDARTEINGLLAQTAHPERYQVTFLTSLRLYVGFAANERGREFAALFDERMERLVASGELRPFYARWKQPYPFDPPEKPHASR
ncbi:substrate-binding periplasmic protein [Metapseudomonas otitidis]|uniref:substrate-binding periplasmic protein n=1 Tax=Metapseudomonas otitidis TaxID=319939 RepID=UPI0013F5E55D|nr:transporter substrate-binding domain-containing protein [Pseudomonas otitidis]